MQVDSVTLKDGSILLAYNNNATARTALTLAKSSDGGVTWQQVVVLEDDPIGSFAYPTILYDQGTVSCQSSLLTQMLHLSLLGQQQCTKLVVLLWAIVNTSFSGWSEMIQTLPFMTWLLSSCFVMCLSES